MDCHAEESKGKGNEQPALITAPFNDSSALNYALPFLCKAKLCMVRHLVTCKCICTRASLLC